MIQVAIEYNFKKASIDDLSIFYESFVEYTNSYLTISEFSTIFEANLKDKNFNLFVLNKKDKPFTVGCVALRLYSEVFNQKINAEIAHLYILPKYRKLQAADALYDCIELKCKDNQINKITVACGINSTLNQNFYTKRKFNYVKKGFSKHID
jgi:N-acetylglutamate synthase-like GNAT family acetyltransferase